MNPARVVVMSRSRRVNPIYKTREWAELRVWAKTFLPWICHVCEEPIAPHLSGRHPRGWTLDHVLPVRTHPHLAYDKSNLKPAHSRCNGIRTATLVADMQRVKTSRRW
ncbi:HNH endonuclease [Nocardia sp. NPDC059180]|uniref:HNH endonuclease n=1 Tax=Nocardia sp. NPDC059180 TaxID=3346761 RepID=UPI0036A5FA52